MRIITGEYKGRHFDVPRSFKARPTTDFAKENLFNVLRSYTDFEGCNALDLFAGTGSITLELLSRGCANVTSIELDRDHHAFITQCVKKLGIGNREQGAGSSVVLKADVFKYIKSCKRQFDIIFADPPYALRELPQIPDLVLGGNLLAEDGIFVFEHGKDNDFSHHPCFVEHRAYGSVNFTFFRKKSVI